MGSQRVGHDWATFTSKLKERLPRWGIHLSTPEMQETQVWSLGREDLLWRKWHPTPVFLPGESHGQRSLAGYSPWGHRVGHSWAADMKDEGKGPDPEGRRQVGSGRSCWIRGPTPLRRMDLRTKSWLVVLSKIPKTLISHFTQAIYNC